MTHSTDKLEITAVDANYRLTTTPVVHKLTSEEISDFVSVMPLHLSLPKRPVLLQNYPNPFNPETWIPFQLSNDANVVISIYDLEGQLIRKIGLGEVPAGVYISKEQSVYWDGKNSFGEKVSSGLYFYQLRAGDYSATRRMLIIK